MHSSTLCKLFKKVNISQRLAGLHTVLACSSSNGWYVGTILVFGGCGFPHFLTWQHT